MSRPRISATRALVRFILLSSGAGLLLLATSGGTGTGIGAGAYIVTTAAIAALEALRWLRLSTDAEVAAVAPLVHRRSPPAPGRPVELIGLEAIVEGARSSGRAARVRLEPRLRELARHRLAVRRGVDFERDPDAAERVLGAEAWVVLRPPHGPVPDPQDPGLSLDSIGAAVAALEAL